MSFLQPQWNSADNNYVIDTTQSLRAASYVPVCIDTSGSTTFIDMDAVHNTTVQVLHSLITEGEKNKWFTKLPSHEQLMKRVRHTFSALAAAENNSSFLQTLLMTPKMITFVWTPTTLESAVPAESPKMAFEDSDEEGDSDSELEEIDVKESELPPVELVSDAKRNQEEYLLTRLRAARARVEEEHLRMQYFEQTGRMPPDSDEEEDSEQEDE
jgi:hypothetical protein